MVHDRGLNAWLAFRPAFSVVTLSRPNEVPGGSPKSLPTPLPLGIDSWRGQVSSGQDPASGREFALARQSAGPQADDFTTR